jgi:hypothetical protein
MSGHTESVPSAVASAVASAALKNKRISWISTAPLDPHGPSHKYQQSWYTNAILLVGEKVFFQVLEYSYYTMIV